ncbi:MAG: acetolactate synthase large subunit [Pseudomonadota bacterium]
MTALHNGAETLVETLSTSGIDVCFTNPGTSEMHLVAALDRLDGPRCVLGLFEGVVTGAADGYARMTGRPAATLLHCGPGLTNGLANIHNARKAGSAMVNLIGDHATWHVEHNAPLTADVVGLATPLSDWVKLTPDATSLAADAADCVAAARACNGKIASLVVPGNAAWDPAEAAAARVEPEPALTVEAERIDAAARRLQNGKRTALLVGGACLHAEPLALAGAIAHHCNARLLSPSSNARTARGRGRTPIQPVPYPVDQALALLADIEQVVLVCAAAPVGFFAYPNTPSSMLPPDCEVVVLAGVDADGPATLQALALALGVGPAPQQASSDALSLPQDAALTPTLVNALVACRLPEQAVLIDEAITGGRDLLQFTPRAAPHDHLQIVGGSIGAGPPLATGAAIACPARQVIALQADGSAMYTLQALWTQAREQLNVVTIVYANRAYRILQHELRNVGAQQGDQIGDVARAMMRLDNPTLDFVQLASGMGVPATRVDSVTGLDRALTGALSTPGPTLIEAVL